FEDMRRPRRSRSLARSLQDPIAFHRRDLNPNRTSRQAEPGGDVIRRRAAGLEQRDDASAGGIKQLLSEHFGHTFLLRPVALVCWRIFRDAGKSLHQMRIATHDADRMEMMAATDSPA